MTIQLLRRPDVEKKTGLSRSTIYKRIDEGTFPKPIPLGGRLVAWLETDIQDWIKQRMKEAGRIKT